MSSALHRISASKAILLVVDVQGKLASRAFQSDHMHKRLDIMVRGCHALGVPILYTEQLPDKLGETTEALRTALNEASASRFVKRTFSCIGNDAEEAWNNATIKGKLDELRALGRDEVLLCGIEAHICVTQTALDLLHQPVKVHLVSDCISSQKEADRAVGLTRMQAAGAVLSSTEMALFEMMRCADLSAGSSFRTVSKLLV